MKRLTLLLAITLAACTTAVPQAPIFFTAERVGSGTIRLALDNGSTDAIGYNLCASGLQRRSGSDWTAVETGEVCTMELRTLNPGHDATFEKTLPAGLEAGEYRYVTGIEKPVGGERISVATEAFRLP